MSLKEHENWKGWQNTLIRHWFYINTGINLFNNFKFLIAAILGVYWTLHLKNPLWLFVMFGVSLPTLAVIGYYSVHHCNKIIDWLNVKFSTYYSLRNITLLEEIRDILNAKKT